MTQVEQLLIKLGVDTRAVATGMRSVRKTITDSLRGIQGQIGQLIGAGMLYNQFSKLGDMAERIRQNADAWGVSTKFVQDIENVARASGVSGDKLQGLIDKMLKALPVGSDLEQEFYKIADRLASIKDPAERARVAIDAFGKSGIDVIRIAGDGSAKVRELAASYQTLSEAELKAADDAKQKTEDIGQRMLIWMGKAIGQVERLSTLWGAFFGGKDFVGKSPWQVLGEANNAGGIVEADTAGVERRRALAHNAKIAKHQKDLAEWQKKQAESQADADKAKLKAAEAYQKKQQEIAGDLRKAMKDYKSNLASLKAAQSGRTEWTLQEIADLSPRDLGRSSWKINQAQDVLWMREEAKFAKLKGNDAYANQLLSRSDQLASGIGGLAASEIDPLIGVKQELEQSKIAAQALTEAALGAGIKIIPVNGK
jgi:hypothetical protein